MASLLTRYLPKGRFFRRMATLSGATLVGQGIVVLSSPLLTRLYTPAEFGLFAVFSAFIGIGGPLMALRYEFAIPVSNDPREADGMTGIAFALILLTSLLGGLGLWFGGESLLRLSGSESLIPYLPLLWLGFVAFSLSLPLIYRTIREGQFRRNGASLIGQFGGQTALHLGFGAAGFGVLGLLLGYVLGYVIRFVTLAVPLPRTAWRQMYDQPPAILLGLAQRHWRYPLFATFTSFFQSLSQLLPTVLFAVLFGPAAAGWFGLGQRLLTMPVRMLGQAASHAFLAEATAHDSQGLYRLFLRTTLRFFAAGLLGGLPLVLFAPPLFAFFFGSDWRMAGVIVQLLVPLHLMRFMIVPVSQLLNIYNRQGIGLLIMIGVSLALVGSFALSWMLDLSLLMTVALYSAGSSLAHLVGLAVVWQTARTRAAGGAAPSDTPRP